MPRPGPKPGSHNKKTRVGQKKKTKKGTTRQGFTLEEKKHIIELCDKGMKCKDIMKDHYPGRAASSISSVYSS